MAVTYKDIDLLTQKVAITGAEKFPVSDTEYVNALQIASLGGGGSTILPSDTWVDGTFSVLGGGSTAYAYYDSRTRIPAGATLERVRMKGSGSGQLTVYLISAADLSTLASETKNIVTGINDITPAFAQSLFSVPTFIAISSSSAIIGMRNSFGSGEESFTNRVTLATGEVSEKIQYIIGVEVTYIPAKVVVDSALSPTSENPVQNKVIYAAIGDIETLLAAI